MQICTRGRGTIRRLVAATEGEEATMAHTSHETYSSESIVHELKNGNTQEAARELNRDLHSSKDFNKTYQEVNSRIDKLNQKNGTNLPHLELVHANGETNQTADSNRSNTTGIKIGDTTYNTNTVRNHTEVDPVTGNKTVTSGNGNNVETLDKNGNQVQTSPEGVTTTKLASNNKYQDKDIGTVVSETRDQSGNKEITNDKGDRKVVTKDGTEVTYYKCGDKSVSRADGSGFTEKHENGGTQIHSWSKTDWAGNYDVTIDSNGNYKKTGNTQTPVQNWLLDKSGKNYQPSEHEATPAVPDSLDWTQYVVSTT